MRNGPEYNQCQRPAWELLTDHLRYEYADGESAAFMATRESEAEPLLVDRFTRKLKEINQGLTDDGARQAVAALKQPLAAGLIDANETCYRLLSRWVTVEQSIPGGREPRSVRYFDFDNPGNNDFLVVEEFWMKGPRWRRRLDLVVFINGIPVVAIECKDPADPHGMSKAVGDLLAYQKPDEGVVRLFHTVQLCVGLKRNDARYGAVCTPQNRYAVWKSYYPVSKQEWERRLEREPTEQDRLLVGMLSKDVLLDLIRNFVVFDRQGGKLVKKIARYQQYEAVNEAIRRVTDPPAELAKMPLRDRGGIVWHTQGSGKSLSMLWLCMKLRRLKELENPTLLIVTDRRSLDRQITQTFKYCGFENPVRAQRVTHLRKLLSGTAGQTVMTTVQKFRDDVDISRGSRHPILSDAENVFVLVDEAHRTEYGRFNAHLRRSLPNACLMAFTGTPIRKTEAKFGSYIHKYTMPQSVADGATVPILYESRLPELAVWGRRIDPLFDAEFSHLTDEQREKLKQQEISERKMAEAAVDRMEMIAADIATHYKENFEPDGFKAQVATCSQKAAGMYYEELSKYFPDRVALLISDPATKDSELWELKKPFEDEDAVIDQFKDEGVDKLAIIVVHNKYLTGFDAPIEQVLYLDRSLGGPGTEHTLLQAIARVNRPLPEKDKQWGLVVDYWGVSAFLDKALAAFGDDLAPEQVMGKRDNEAAFHALKQRQADVFGMFDASFTRDDIEPWILSLEEEDRRAIFQSRYRAFYKALEQLLPDPRALNYLGDFAWLRRLRREMLAYFSTEDLELPDCSAKVRELINRHVRGEEVRVLLEPIPIMSENFAREVAKLQSPRAKASRMEHAISRTVTVKLHEDPAFYETVKERLERIINDRRDQRIDDAEEFKLLLSLREEMTSGRDQEAASLGLSEDTAPFFGIMRKELGTETGLDAEGTATLAQNVVESLREQSVIDWQDKEDVQRDMRRAVKRQLRLAGCPAETIDGLTVQIMDLARVRLN